MNKRVKELKEKYRQASERAKKAAKVAEQTSLRVTAASELAAGALSSIHVGVDIGQGRSSLTATVAVNYAER